MWNLPAGPAEPSIAAVEQFLAERRPKPDELAYPLDLRGPHYSSDEWRPVFEKSEFDPLTEARLPNPQTIDREGGGGVLRFDGLDRRLARYGETSATGRSEVTPHC